MRSDSVWRERGEGPSVRPGLRGGLRRSQASGLLLALLLPFAIDGGLRAREKAIRRCAIRHGLLRGRVARRHGVGKKEGAHERHVGCWRADRRLIGVCGDVERRVCTGL